MIKRALLCGLGKSYSQISLAILPLDVDINRIIQRLNGPTQNEEWESIDVIDDSNVSVFDGEKNKIILANELMATKENIKKSISEIIVKGVDLMLFYFSGHGDKIGDKFFMITYNQEFFHSNDLLGGEAREAFFTDQNYITFFNELLQTNPSLIIISIIDCCFSATICNRTKSIGKFLDRHVLICSSANESITDVNQGSFFTESVVKSATDSNTYLKFQTRLAENLGTMLSININVSLNNNNLPF